jgi:hypothetical protein
MLEEPAPEAELPFDVERDITPEDWKRIEPFLAESREKGEWGFFAWRASAMKLLFPKRVEELGLDNEAWAGTKKQLEQYRYSDDMTGRSVFYHLAANMKVLFPERTDELKLDEETWENMRSDLRSNLEKPLTWSLEYHHLYYMALLFPEKMNELLNDKVRNVAVESFKEDLKRGLVLMVERGAQLRVILGELTSQQLGFGPEEWREMTDSLEDSRIGKPVSFLFDATHMKILAAEKVEVTDKGLEINMRRKKDSLTTAAAEMPEQRNF